ncbi:MAG: hypothetical protein JXB46_02795 [Candidatus Eisenbacteria bacterium]|nr:hypothetical protein [Candidatus Eisenbacteria bacterium]
MPTTVVELPQIPKDKEYEEYISAYLQSSGYYVERNIVERDVEEVLELDVIATDYLPEDVVQVMVEIKSGKNWGFSDIFKLRGWMTYLGYSRALFVATVPKGREDVDDFYVRKSAEMSVDLKIVTELQETQVQLASYLHGKILETIDIATWRFAYWIERKLVERLTKCRRSLQNVQRYEAMFAYYNEINNSVFFTSNILERIRQLFANFQRNANISAKVGTELSCGAFEGDEIPSALFRSTYFDCQLNDLSISSYLEFKSRLTILKYVVDFLAIRDSNPEDERISDHIDFMGVEMSRFDFLPKEFLDRMERLGEHPYYRNYPAFWQWFVWFFGGFVLLDYKEEEYKMLSQRSGIPVDDIDKAFEAMSTLFPTDSGWFVDHRTSSIRLLKIFPVPFRGNGADFRKKVYTDPPDYHCLRLTGSYTLNDLIKWNNACVDFLK